MPVAAILARVSTPQQAKSDRHGIPNQLAECRKYAATAGFTIPEDGVYVDAISGMTDTREALDQLLLDAHKYDAVLVYAVDRIGRDEEGSHKIIRLLRKAGLEVHASTRGLVEKDFMTSIEIAWAAEERRSIRRRTLAGMRALAAEGKIPAAMNAYGYKHIRGEHRVEINETEAAIVRRIFREAAARATFYEIATSLNDDGILTRNDAKWSVTQISRIIRRSAYRGSYEWTFEGRTYDIPVPPIVTPAEWKAAQRKRRGPVSPTGRPLVGYLRCGLCGGSMNVRNAKNRASRTAWYRCGNSTKIERRCRGKLIRAVVLEEHVERELRAMLTNRRRLQEIVTQAQQEETPDHSGQVAALEDEEARLLEAMLKGFISVDEYGTARAEVRRRIEAAQPRVQERPNVDAILKRARRASLRELVEIADASIVVLDGSITIRVRL